jgi:hypothetical protein
MKIVLGSSPNDQTIILLMQKTLPLLHSGFKITIHSSTWRGGGGGRHESLYSASKPPLPPPQHMHNIYFLMHC